MFYYSNIPDDESNGINDRIMTLKSHKDFNFFNHKKIN